jgi:hypothetical protein
MVRRVARFTVDCCRSVAAEQKLKLPLQLRQDGSRVGRFARALRGGSIAAAGPVKRCARGKSGNIHFSSPWLVQSLLIICRFRKCG